MNARNIVAYYAREEVQQALVQAAAHREAIGVFRTGSFGKRPGTLHYPQDIISQARKGVVEFHYSIEHWNNPVTLDRRIGFDLLFDLDCKVMEHGKIAALLLVELLQKHGIEHPSIKFSGNRGFHVGIPWASLPKEIDFTPTQELFPDVARKVATYVREQLRDSLEVALLKTASPEQLAKQTEQSLTAFASQDGIDPFRIVDIDPVLISTRHLVRMPYSLNKKAFLVSLPLTPDALKGFRREDADPAKVKVSTRFMSSGKEREGETLFAEGLDWFAHHRPRQAPPGKKRMITTKVPADRFPPCMKIIEGGLQDGKKRAVFILINFLRSMKWEWEEIEAYLGDWNKKNTPPLPEQYLVTSVRYYRNKKHFPPPNCTQEWYVSMGVCKPDAVCGSRESIKNPVNYPFRKRKRS